MSTILKNNAGDSFRILKEYNKKIRNRFFKMWLIQFTDTGFTKEIYESNGCKGKVKDLYKPSFYGVGYSGEHSRPYYWKQARRLWENMIKRCYDPNYPSGYYGRGITVDERWKCFANFLEDLPELENFKKWLDGFNSDSDSYNLDKDLKVESNTVYCKECCSFVLESINKAAGAKNGKPYTKNPRPVKNKKMGIE